MKRPRVLFVHNFYRFRGGEDRLVERERQLLSSHGVSTGLFSEDSSRIEALPWPEKLENYARTIYNAKARDSLAKILKREAWDVVHFHNLHPYLTSALLDAVPVGVKKVATLHNYRTFCVNGLFLRQGRACEWCPRSCRLWGVVFRCFQSSWPASALASLSQSVAAGWVGLKDKMDLFLCPSRFLLEKYVGYGFPAAKMIEVSNFAQAQARISPSGQRYGIYLGRLSQEKGVMVLAQALEKLGGPPFVLAGDGPLREDLARRLARFKKVRLAGPLSRASAGRVLARAAYMVMPSLCYENQPLAVLEALAAGVPVVASTMGSLPEIIREGLNGWLAKPSDAPALAVAMQKAAALSGRRRVAVRHAARRSWKEKYSPETHFKNLMKAYLS